MYKDPNILQLKNQEAAAIVNKWGVDVFTIRSTIPWLVSLHDKGILGSGKEINTDLPFELIGHPGWLEMLFQKIVSGEDIGLDLREGNMRAAEKWGRLEPDLKSGDLNCPWWGYSEHENSRIQADWSFYSMVADRDCNEHGITNVVGRYPRYGYAAEGLKTVPLDDCVRIMSEKLIPFEGDPMMLDGSTEARYSVHMAKMVAWQAYYSRFWKQGINYCDWGWPDFVNVSAPNYSGYTPEGEPWYYNAVTGKNLTFRQGMEIGRKVWNWQNAIWVLQGRHRDIVKFAEFVYEVPNTATHYLLGYNQDKEQWVWEDYGGHTVDRQKFEEWKTKYYEVMGWDTATGWPNRKTLEEVGLGFVADKLEEKGKLGS
jgi:aldehyde:ferredoxin oxidoreductase